MILKTLNDTIFCKRVNNHFNPRFLQENSVITNDEDNLLSDSLKNKKYIYRKINFIGKTKGDESALIPLKQVYINNSKIGNDSIKSFLDNMTIYYQRGSPETVVSLSIKKYDFKMMEYLILSVYGKYGNDWNLEEFHYNSISNVKYDI